MITDYTRLTMARVALNFTQGPGVLPCVRCARCVKCLRNARIARIARIARNATQSPALRLAGNHVLFGEKGRLKMRDMKMRDQIAGVETAGKVSMESHSVKKCLKVVVFVCRVIPSV